MTSQVPCYGRQNGMCRAGLTQYLAYRNIHWEASMAGTACPSAGLVSLPDEAFVSQNPADNNSLIKKETPYLPGNSIKG